MKPQNKTVAFFMSAFIALGMFWFEVEKTQTIDILGREGIGHFLVLLGLNACGLVLFYLAGNLWKKNTVQAVIVFVFSIALRVFIYHYIETLELECVFQSGERWTMHAGNISLAFIEVAFAFTQTKDDRTDSRIRELQEQIQTQIDDRQALKAAHKAALAKAIEHTKSKSSAEIEALKEKLVHADMQLQSTSDSVSALRFALEKKENALAMHQDLIDAVGKPQLFGTRYRMITKKGAIVKCDAQGKLIK